MKMAFSLLLCLYNKDYRDKNIPFDTQLAGAIGAALFGNALLMMGKARSVRKA